MWPVPQQLVELEALNAELRAESVHLHERLAARDRLIETLARYIEYLEARVWTLRATLDADARKRQPRKPGPRPLPLRVKLAIAVRYVLRGGLVRPKGQVVKGRLMAEFGVKERTVEKVLAEAASWRTTPGEAAWLVKEYGGGLDSAELDS
jgi:hypothetical protein